MTEPCCGVRDSSRDDDPGRVVPPSGPARDPVVVGRCLGADGGVGPVRGVPTVSGGSVISRVRMESRMVGVGRLVTLATTEGRTTTPGLAVGVCGEHGREPGSILIFDTAGLDDVSRSPFRVPVARLEAGRVVLGRAEEDTSDDPDDQRADAAVA